MATLTLTSQETAKSSIAPKLLTLKQEMDKRLPIWQKIDREKKTKWVKSGKDPIVSIAWDTYKYLRDNFFGEVE